MCMAESPGYLKLSTLSIGYTPVQNKKFKYGIKKESALICNIIYLSSTCSISKK